MKISITGATGFIGSYIARKFLTEDSLHKLVCLRRESSNLKMLGDHADRIEWVNGDLNDIDALDYLIGGADLVIHCAGIVSFNRRDKAKMYEANVSGTENVVNICIDKKIPKLLYVSSTIVLGHQDGEYDESIIFDINKKQSYYGFTKQLAEQEVWRGIAEGLNAIVICPPLVMGAGPWDQEPLSLFKYSYTGNPFYPSGSNGMVDVRDLARMCYLLSGTDIANNKRIICCSANIQLKEMAIEIAKLLSKPLPKYKLSNTLGYLIARFTQIISPFVEETFSLSYEEVKIANANLQYDNQWSTNLLQFEYIDWRRSLKESAVVFQKTYPKNTPYGIFSI